LAKAIVGISTGYVAVDQATDPGTALVGWIAYTTSDITDIDGNTITRGKFTLTWQIGSTVYTASSSQ